METPRLEAPMSVTQHFHRRGGRLATAILLVLIVCGAGAAQARPDDERGALPGAPARGAPAPAVSTSPLGVWTGNMSETIGPGETVTYPLTISVTRETGGSMHVDIHTDSTVRTSGGPLSFMVQHRMRGTMQGNTLVATGYEKRIRVNGQERSETPDRAEFTVRRGRLSGRFGAPGRWSTVDFTRSSGARPIVVTPPARRVDVVGRWAGTLSETLDGGTKLTYPARIHVDANRDGRGHAVSIEMEMKYPVKGVETSVAIGHKMIGTYKDGRLTCRGMSKTVRVNDKESRESPEDAVMRVVDGRLVGRFGKNHLGWSDFRFRREDGSLAAPTIESGQIPPPTRTKAPDTTSTARALHGAWSGTMEETLPSGEQVSYPVRISISRPSELENYTITMVIDATIRDEAGAQRRVVIEQVMRGPRSADSITAKGSTKVIVEDGTRREAKPDNGVFAVLADGSLRGKFGTDAEGWSSFHYEREATSLAPTEQPGSEYEGSWQGMKTEVADDGTKRTVPITISITTSPDGRGLQVISRVRSSIPGTNGPLPLTVVEEFDAEEVDGRLRGRGTKKSVTVDGRPENGTLDTLEFALRDGQLTGQIGNDIEGFNTVSLRNAGALAGATSGTTTSEPFAATWRGEVSEKVNGQMITYPIALIITKTTTGYTVQMGAEAQSRDAQGQSQVIEIRETFSGSASQGVLTLQGTRKDMHINGVKQAAQVDRAVLRLQDDALVGELGNDLEGMVPVRLARQ